jgi:hypothetical protein
MSKTPVSRWGVIALLLAVGGFYVWGTYQFFTRLVPGGNDFLCHYSLWQACARYGLNPYSDQAAAYTQLAIYGRAARPDEDQNVLVYPFYSVLVYGPYIVFDYAFARALFMTLLQLAVVGGVWLTLGLLDWRPPPWLTAALMLWSLLNYPEARAVLIGQFAPLGFLALAGALWLLKRKRDGWAGVLLVLATVKPTLVYLIIPCLVLWALLRRRWRFIFGLGGGVLALSLVSFVVLPSWLGDWLKRVSGYSGYRATQGVVWQLTHVAFPALGQPGEIMLIGALVAALAWIWWRVLRVRDGEELEAEFLWAVGVTLVVSFLIDARTATPNYVLMLIPTFGVFAVLDRRGGRGGRLWIVLSMLALFIGQWWLHFSTVIGNAEQAAVFLPWPIALGLALVCGRRWLVAANHRAEKAL